MGIGKYNKRLLLQQPPTGQDAAGAPSTVFTDFATVWAHIAPIKGAEAVSAGHGSACRLDIDRLGWCRGHRCALVHRYGGCWRCGLGLVSENCILDGAEN